MLKYHSFEQEDIGVPHPYICDGLAHCADESDEKDCPFRFSCDARDGKLSIPEEKKCDGKEDCKDGDDEQPDECPGRFFCPSLDGNKVRERSFHSFLWSRTYQSINSTSILRTKISNYQKPGV